MRASVPEQSNSACAFFKHYGRIMSIAGDYCLFEPICQGKLYELFKFAMCDDG